MAARLTVDIKGKEVHRKSRVIFHLKVRLGLVTMEQWEDFPHRWAIWA